VWPESERAGIRGIGRGAIAGSEVFWPARDAIYVLSAMTGERTRPPIKPENVNYHGANLAVAHGHLIIATHSSLLALAPMQSNQTPVSRSRTSSTAPLRTDRLSGQ
jgi:hypothetical protein